MGGHDFSRENCTAAGEQADQRGGNEGGAGEGEGGAGGDAEQASYWEKESAAGAQEGGGRHVGVGPGAMEQVGNELAT
jgi:hypothetical protein